MSLNWPVWTSEEGCLVPLANLSDWRINTFNFGESYSTHGAEFDIQSFEWNHSSRNKSVIVLGTTALVSQFFTGSIPAAIGQFQHLGLLGLSNNRLSGEIPKSL
ncbi:hypothetical protein HYC85_020842 [Camellia sinensis]|uniref:Leucine-rich repeat-containing N-terminal plant-type domain-containing protein n=1 Tax=Camellia sinensis TaxID=4442 RepID=A0A7J7GRA2_CAMSI|nr:hypothetical protein HYC85_020842 [Camellia sinensis]